jgi:SAM-dependent methyltransferase
MNESTSMWEDPNYYDALAQCLKDDALNREIIHAYGKQFNRPGAVVADVGCGTCLVQPLFNQAIYHGFDSSHELVSRARHDQCLNCKKNFNVDWASVYRLPMADQAADLTVCVAVLLHVGFPKHALREIWRVTNKRLIFSAYYRRFGIFTQGAQAVRHEDMAKGMGWWTPIIKPPLWWWNYQISQLPGVARVQRVRYIPKPPEETGLIGAGLRVLNIFRTPIYYWILDREGDKS